MSDKLAPVKRHQVKVNDKVIYEWDQTFSEVNIYVNTPTGILAKMIYCHVEARHLKFGMGSNPPYMDCDLGGQVKVSESFWTLEDRELHVTLQKLLAGESWISAVKGHDIDILSQEDEKKRLLLERFQMEHRGFDFSNAEVSGNTPNPRTFMKN